MVPLPRTDAVHEVSAGVVAMGTPTQPSALPIGRLRADAGRIRRGAVDAVVYTPGGDGTPVLLAPADVVLLRADLLPALGRAVPELAGRSRGVPGRDPAVVLLDVQWQVNLLAGTVIALDGPAAAVDERPEALARRRRDLLRMLTVNLSSCWLGTLLPLAQLAMVSGALASAGVDTSALDLQRAPGGDNDGTLALPAGALTGALALDAAGAALPEDAPRRDAVQAMRRLPDPVLASLVRDALPVLTDERDDTERARVARLRGLLGVDRLLEAPLELLVAEPGDPSAGGLAAGLAAGLGDGGPRLRRFDTRAQRADDGTALDAVLARADAVVLRGATLLDVPGLAFTRLPLLVDLRGTDLLSLMRNAARTDGPGAALADLCERADTVVVDDDQSRDILLGALAGAHRVNDAVYDSDPSLSELVAVDPAGAAVLAFCRRPVRAADRVLDAGPDGPASTHRPPGGGARTAARCLVAASRRLMAVGYGTANDEER
ncbi:hypothetical protein [uncultured Actinomyces sp.]|uniref:hypothetical protein n=1 Tax=uncultured Actinomyces sp. TaxID=249061 RepID=UPI002889F535|nr:hypothetical protein [uncultured Actinomyces sp.]